MPCLKYSNEPKKSENIHRHGTYQPTVGIHAEKPQWLKERLEKKVIFELKI